MLIERKPFRLRIRSAAVLALCCWVSLSAASASTAEATWWWLYDHALETIAAGDGAAAREALVEALALRPEPGLRVPTEGLRSVDYLPHLHLAIAAHLEGDPESAHRHLERAESLGVAARSEAGSRLLEAYRVLLGSSSPEVEATAAETPDEAPDFARYPRRDVVLSDEEASVVERGVLRRCGLDESTDRTTAPWYYHYELGLELAERGDPQRAVDALVSAVERRDDPERSTRLYGMWFIDYLPYFQIARLHATLGNLDCARDALRLSTEKGELMPDDDNYTDFQILSLELERP